MMRISWTAPRTMMLAALAAASVAVAGCGASSTPSAKDDVAATASAAVVPDEQQIRDLVTQMAHALEDYDLDADDKLTCQKYRSAIRADNETLMPPMSTFGTPEQVANPAFIASLRDHFPSEFPTVSSATTDALFTAVQKQDKAAYRIAAIALVRESLTVEKFGVSNIKITGDTATGDVTATIKATSKPAETVTKANTFIREDGQWKDCEPPGSNKAS